MKKLIVLSLLLFLGNIAIAQDAMQVFINSLGQKYVEKHPQSVMIVGVIVNGESKYFSFAKEGVRKADTTDVFEVGQITQSFTSILFSDMVIQGLISADDSLEKFLPIDVPSPVYAPMVCKPVPRSDAGGPDFQVKNNPVFVQYTPYVCYPDVSERPQPILLCYLSTHTSGLPDLPGNLKSHKSNPFSDYQKSDMYEFLRTYNLTEPIGYNFKYSSLGTSLLGHVLELKTGVTYDSLLATRLLNVIGMRNSGVSRKDKSITKLMTGFTAKGRPATHWTFDVLAPSAGMYSTMGDMMKFASANISTLKSPLKDVLDYTHNPRILFQNKKSGESAVALGWYVNPVGAENINYVWQQGLTGGFASFVGFTETTRTAVIILTNAADPVSEIGKEILKKLNK